MLDIEQSALRRAEPKDEDVKAKRQIKAKCAARNKMQNGQSNKFSIFTWNVEEGYLYRCGFAIGVKFIGYIWKLDIPCN